MKDTLTILFTLLQFEFLLSIKPEIILNILEPFRIVSQDVPAYGTNNEITDLEIVIGIDHVIPGLHLGPSVSFMGNISQVANMEFNYEHKKLIAVLVSRNESSFFDVLQQISSKFHSDNDFNSWRPYWFLCYPKEIHPKLFSAIRNSILKSQVDIGESKSVPLDSDLYIVFDVSEGKETNISIWELYSVKNVTILDEINVRDLLNMDFIVNISRKAARRNNFQGIRIVGAAGYDPDYPFETAFDDHSNSSFKSGLAVSIYRDMKYTLNFSEGAITGTWMVFNASDSIDWLVLKGLADIAISQTTLTLDTRPDTNTSLTFIQPTSSARLNAILVQPPASTIRNIFVAPFTTSLWAALAATLLFIIFTTIGIAAIKQRAGHWDPGAETISQQASIWALGTFCQQGYWHIAPVSASMKVVFMTAATAGMVCYIGYSATIVSTLTNKVIPIRNVLDLRNSSLTIYGDISDSSSEYVFEGWVNVSNEKSIITPENALSVLTKSTSAFLGFTDAFFGAARRLNYDERELCEKFSYLTFSHVDYKSSMFIKKGSPFREFFNHKVIVMKEKGLNHKYMNTYNRFANLRCAEENATEKKSLGLNDVFTSFALLVTAYLLCCAILFFEKIGSVSGPSFDRDSFSFHNQVISLDKIVSSGKTDLSIFTVRSEISSKMPSRRSSF